ncbi:MAG: hypothetical protein DME64_11715 [Verrucomicrobia bacterium]|nr:MAG: hypothetical protein DME64_11715 [Verrucomicrobiota bacterium]
MERAAATLLRSCGGALVSPHRARRTQRDQFDASPNSGAWNADKICLANYYSFVIMRGNYDKNVAFFWNQPPMVRPVNCICVFDISCG